MVLAKSKRQKKAVKSSTKSPIKNQVERFFKAKEVQQVIELYNFDPAVHRNPWQR